MKRWNWLYLTLLLLAAVPAFAATGNVNLFLGQKSLDSSDWNAPYDDQGEFGVLFDFRGESWPLSIAVDLLGSARTVDYGWFDRIASTTELDFGVRKNFDFPGSSAHPFIGGGLAIVTARLEDTSGLGTFYVDDSALGVWLNGGIYWTLGEHFNLGLQARYSQADVTLAGVSVNAGGTHAGIMLGYHW